MGELISVIATLPTTLQEYFAADPAKVFDLGASLIVFLGAIAPVAASFAKWIKERFGALGTRAPIKSEKIKEIANLSDLLSRAELGNASRLQQSLLDLASRNVAVLWYPWRPGNSFWNYVAMYVFIIIAIISLFAGYHFVDKYCSISNNFISNALNGCAATVLFVCMLLAIFCSVLAWVLAINGVRSVPELKRRRAARRIIGESGNKLRDAENRITIAQARNLAERGSLALVDARTEREWEKDGLPGAYPLPCLERGFRVCVPLLVYSDFGARSMQAVRELRDSGYEAYDLGSLVDRRRQLLILAKECELVDRLKVLRSERSCSAIARHQLRREIDNDEESDLDGRAEGYASKHFWRRGSVIALSAAALFWIVCLGTRFAPLCVTVVLLLLALPLFFYACSVSETPTGKHYGAKSE